MWRVRGRVHEAVRDEAGQYRGEGARLQPCTRPSDLLTLCVLAAGLTQIEHLQNKIGNTPSVGDMQVRSRRPWACVQTAMQSITLADTSAARHSLPSPVGISLCIDRIVAPVAVSGRVEQQEVAGLQQRGGPAIFPRKGSLVVCAGEIWLAQACVSNVSRPGGPVRAARVRAGTPRGTAVAATHSLLPASSVLDIF